MPCQFWWCAFDKKILRKLAQHTPARTLASIAKMRIGNKLRVSGLALKWDSSDNARADSKQIFGSNPAQHAPATRHASAVSEYRNRDLFTRARTRPAGWLTKFVELPHGFNTGASTLWASQAPDKGDTGQREPRPCHSAC